MARNDVIDILTREDTEDINGPGCNFLKNYIRDRNIRVYIIGTYFAVLYYASI